MKHIVSILMIIAFASFSQAQDSFESLWKTVEKHEKDGLPKSALEIVGIIAQKAKSENNKPQRIKALLYKSKFALTLEEDAQLKIINDFKTEIASNEAPLKNILENMLATLYWQYFQQNRYRFYNRTNTEAKVDTEDFRTWDLQTLIDEINLHYQKSLENGLILQQENLEDYNLLLHKQKESKIYRPTLFDLLAHNALDFYKTDENSITKPAYTFKIDNPDYLGTAGKFLKLHLTSKDTSSLQLNALKVFKKLYDFHLPDASPYPFAALDIERLKFVAQHATFKDKKEVLLQTLKTESERTKTSDVSSLYDFEIASIYVELGRTYISKENETHRWKLKEAVELCNRVLEKFPNTRGSENCRILKQQILQQSLQVNSETYIPVDSPSRILVRYKNLHQLQLSIYKISIEELEQFNTLQRAEQKSEFLNQKKSVENWTTSLKNEKDYQTHTTELVIPKLANGIYIILAKSNNNKDTFAVSSLQVTDLALVEKAENKKHLYQLINRNNGQPIVGASVSMSFKRNYNSAAKTKSYKTDSNGQFSVVKPSASRYFDIKFDVKHLGQTAYFGDYYLYGIYNNGQREEERYKGFLFTDRSIYRPGQTVYFKGIVMTTKDEKSSVVEDEEVSVRLINVNGEQLNEVNFSTNAFGSFNGEFILPNNSLTGQFHIEISGRKNLNTYHHFSVEEYKRPKFETKFEPITETYKVNDSIVVTGNAVAYAGSSITDAKVVYCVHRKVQYPQWYYWRRPWFNSEPQEIRFGETVTGTDGKFEITFPALPDDSVDKAGLPTFRYEVTADVTDLNGETRSATTTVNVGYHAMTVNISVAAKIDKDNKDHTLSIDAKNLNGQEVPAKGTLKIYKLLAPKHVLRPRPWMAPDYQEIPETEFKSLFPNDTYTNESNTQFWKKGELVFERNFDTETSKDIALGKIKKWQSGAYGIELESEDRFGQPVKDEARTLLYSKNDKILADNELFSITTNSPTYKPNETVSVTIASSTKLTVTLEVEKDHKVINTYIIPLDNDKKQISIPVSKEDLGGFVVHYSYAAFNSFGAGSKPISVPYPKTDLDIETTTFRDKLQPGSDETWSFKVKGPKGEQVSAELLASMYDASLDQFKPHRWSFNPLQPSYYYSNSRRRANRSFGTRMFRIYNQFYGNSSFKHQTYDQLNWFGLSFGNYYHTRRNYLRSIGAQSKSRFKSEKRAGIAADKIKGIVKDEYGDTLPGVNIIIDGTTTGTTSDFDGLFEIEAKEGVSISVSYIGHETLSFKVTENNYYIITLVEDAVLDEVVVVGYGNRRSKSAPAAMALEEAVEYENDAIQSLDGVAGGLNVVSQSENSDKINLRGVNSLIGASETLFIIDGKPASEEDVKQLNEKDIISLKVIKDSEALSVYGEKGKNGVVLITTKQGSNTFEQVKIRKNLKETAFFFPSLQTDDEGNVSFSFTSPEALTKWKLQLLAHTKTLESATMTLEAVTQKELMVIPNAPRFLREGDRIVISSKIANLSDKKLSGQAKLELTDPITGNDITELLLANALEVIQDFSVDNKSNTQVSWLLTIPSGTQAVQYKIMARAEDFSDGEQNALPVLFNRMLVTETLPMWIKSNETRTFTLDKLASRASATKSKTLKHHKLTLEITSNPAWYAVQALPYLMEYPYECNEQTFSRYYANALASHIANSNPRIQEVFNQWKNTDALLSNLEKNEELKSILIEETPWLRGAQSETEQKKRIALLFDLNKMNSELASAKRKLKKNQMNNGAWPWFNGGRPNRFITQHIITGFGHLKHLSVSDGDSEDAMIRKAMQYLDSEFVQEYKDLRKYNKNADLSKDHLSHTQLHYLYMRSFFSNISTSKEVKDIMDYYYSQIRTYWLSRSLYSKGLMALVAHRNEDSITSAKILKSLRENSITSDELGMYWKANTASWYWYQAPIETQALLIEAFAEIENDTETIDNLKIWLLKNKQTNRWKTTKATTEAVYALLLQGSDWLSVTDAVDVLVGGQPIASEKISDVKVEAGTGYYKTTWNTNEIKPQLSEVTLTKKGDGIAWGSLYWQYFEDLDNITSAETPLSLKKKLFLKTNTDKGEQISEITHETKLEVGDLVRVRIELRSDRNMEFIHMKDMRAAGLEPINVLSQYKWQDGLGYYESTKDASTNFFFDYLPKGVYVFEYDLRVNNAGDMSNGITTIQSMYAPEFSSHSEGVRINVE